MSKLWMNAVLRLTENADAEETKAALLALRTETVKEAGCYQFEILEQLDNPGHFTLWECFENEAALASHYDAAYTRDFLGRNLIELVKVDKLNKLG